MPETQLGNQSKVYTPAEMFDELDGIVSHRIMDPVLMMGGSGIGKSSIVRQVCDKHGLVLCDVRWGQLTPVDARGVPVPKHDTGETVFYTPDFWPKKPRAVIFLDEFNMASTTMMGLGQQLLLDRMFGSYKVPEEVWIWAAGNRKTDKGAVNEIPAPVHNRVAHYLVTQSLESWEFWAYAHDIAHQIIGFLKARTELLHKPTDTGAGPWPSPRTWEMADRRFKAGMDMSPVIGEASNSEFLAYQMLRSNMPDLSMIIAGNGNKIEFPEEPSLKFAVISELTFWAIKSWDNFHKITLWFLDKCSDQREHTSMFILDTLRILQRIDKPKNLEYMQKLMKLPEAKDFIFEYVKMTTGRGA
jgi:hypothetical protein